jgi:hypothetical protein
MRLIQDVDIVTVKELLGHSTVPVTMHYLHPNFEAKVQAVAKLAAICDNPATVRTKLQQSTLKLSPNAPVKSRCQLYVETEERVSG